MKLLLLFLTCLSCSAQLTPSSAFFTAIAPNVNWDQYVDTNGMVGWFEVQDENNGSGSNPLPMATWQDHRGGGITALSGANPPSMYWGTNAVGVLGSGQAYAQFDGVNDTLTKSVTEISTNQSVVAIARPDSSPPSLQCVATAGEGGGFNNPELGYIDTGNSAFWNDPVHPISVAVGISVFNTIAGVNETYGGGVGRVYTNGVLATTDGAFYNSGPHNKLRVGCAEDGASRFFKGKLVAVLFYQRALTAAEVARLEKWKRKFGI